MCLLSIVLKSCVVRKEDHPEDKDRDLATPWGALGWPGLSWVGRPPAREAVKMVLPQPQPLWAQTLWQVPAARKQQGVSEGLPKSTAGPGQVVRGWGQQ